jgi:hypothetical protein
MLFFVACKGCVIDGPAVRGKEFRLEPSRGYIVCRERYADDRYALLPAYNIGPSLHVQRVYGYQ